MAIEHEIPDGAVMIVVGATGDLAHRKLFPALAHLAARGALPTHFSLVGFARTELSDAEFDRDVRTAIERADPRLADAWVGRAPTVKYVTGAFDDPAAWSRLRQVVEQCDHDHGAGGHRLFYLSTLPQFFESVLGALGDTGLAQDPPGGFARVVIEKPFGRDLASARELDRFVHAHFDERQVFRIDHYLGKETVQNVLALRFANAIFEPVWNRRYIDHVQITVAESIGVEHRGTFYEQAGTLRDIVQNHAMQVLSLVAMEPPASFDADAIRDEKVKVLRSVVPIDLEHDVVRGQYGAGIVAAEPVVGYRDEEGVAPDSTTETFLATRLLVDNWRWAGVPFHLRAGKRLAEHVTEVVLRFRPVPHLPLPTTAVDSMEPNSLVLRIQPDEGIRLEFGAKIPGRGFAVRTVGLDFSYRAGFEEVPPEAYERLLLDALAGDATLFIREDEVDVAWQIVQPIIDAIAAERLAVHEYPAGTWGPSAANDLLATDGDRWRNG